MFKENEDESVQRVITQLKSYGFDARRMPERKKKSCDIIARAGRSEYYIEVKERIGPTKPGSYTVKYGYNSSVNKIIENGLKQLKSMPGFQNVFNILWMIIPEDDEEEFLLQGILHTIYGIQSMVFKIGDIVVELDCFYFHNCTMKKSQFLDAVIIQTMSGLIFCLNDISLKYKRFKKTKLFQIHKRLNGVIDPAALEKQKCCIISPLGKNKEQRYQRLLTKYGFKSVTVFERERFLGIGKPKFVREPSMPTN